MEMTRTALRNRIKTKTYNNRMDRYVVTNNRNSEIFLGGLFLVIGDYCGLALTPR